MGLGDEGPPNNVVALYVHNVWFHFVKNMPHFEVDFPGDADAVGVMGRG